MPTGRVGISPVGEDGGMTTVGTVFLPQFPPERLLPAAAAAEAAGLAQLWLWEDCFALSGIASAAAVLGATRRLAVGVGLLPVPMRNVATTAMELATLHRLFPGRAVLGVGHGVQDWMDQIGARVGSPLTLLREQLDALRDLLAGRTVTTSGRYVRLDGVTLAWPPDPAPPVLAGGEGPKTLTLTGGHADGSILVGGTTPDQVRRTRELLAAGAAAAGRTGPHPVVVYLPTAFGADVRDRVDRFAARWGWESTVDRFATGAAADVAAQVARLAAAGADTVVLQPTEDEPDLPGFLATAAEVGRLC
jgi:alkanesulfonate monooxygenase SsuD/methylene tetrahydromethanopterin reductase-like flavin-dependent oxidoreductase (luciferase family)